MRPRRVLAVLVAAAVAAASGCGSDQAPERVPAGPGRVLYRAFHSPAIDGTEHFAIYLPGGYGATNRRYPVIYALHGLPSGAAGYRQLDIAEWGRAAQGAGGPVLVVAPQGARRGDSDPEWHDWGPGRNWETAVAVDVVHHVDATFRTLDDRRSRALIGVSAGGYGATIIAVHHPEVYSVIQSWSGYFHPTDPEGSAPLDVGTPEDNARADAHTFVPVAKEIYRGYQPTFFGFYIGDADPHFIAENELLHEELLREHISHTYAMYPGGHTGSFWVQHQDAWIGDAVDDLAR